MPAHQSPVAVVTQKSPDHSVRMIMVHAKPSLKISRRSETDRTTPVLALKKFVVVIFS